MKVVPLTIKEANRLVRRWHRHSRPVHGARFAIGLELNGRLCGAAIVGRPVAQRTEQYTVAEVTRLVSPGTQETKNACSFLYGACARIAREMGFAKVQTFILKSEPGTSLLAAGWKLAGESAGGGWSRPSRARRGGPQQPKKKFERVF